MQLKKSIPLIVFLFINLAQIAQANLPKYSYDAGPDPKTEMGKELIDLVAAIPNMPQISKTVMG